MSRADRAARALLTATSAVAAVMALGNIASGDQQWAMTWCALAVSCVAMRRTV